MRILLFKITAIFTFLLLFYLMERAEAFEDGYDRPGGEYLGHFSGVANARSCYRLCRKNNRCVAFSWEKSTVHDDSGICWLKGSLSIKVKKKNFVSGIVRQGKRDICSWKQKGSGHLCFCHNRLKNTWYIGDASACPKEKPSK
jgi:hypothetical protein